MIPETIRLADYGLGHDDRAKKHQPVVSRLGPRFLPWQLEKTAEEAWEETKRHAALINRIMREETGPRVGAKLKADVEKIKVVVSKKKVKDEKQRELF